MTGLSPDSGGPSPTLPPMRARHLIATLAGVAAVAAALPAAAPAEGPLTGVIGDMRCVAPTDAAGIDAILAAAGSPMAGEGPTIVTEAAAAGHRPARHRRDRRARDACSRPTARRRRSTTRSGSAPASRSPSEREAIVRAVVDARRAGTSPRAAPPSPRSGPSGRRSGAANDPGGLNANWTTGTGDLLRRDGRRPGAHDPAGRPGGRARAAPPRRPGRRDLPTPGAVRPAGGDRLGRRGPGRVRHDAPPTAPTPPPARAATIEGFVFPLALPEGAPATFRDQFGEPGPRRVRRPGRADDRDRPRGPRRRRGRGHPARRVPGRARGGHRLLARHRRRRPDRLRPAARVRRGRRRGRGGRRRRPPGRRPRLPARSRGSAAAPGSTPSPSSRPPAPPPDGPSAAGRDVGWRRPRRDEEADVDAVVLSETGGPEVLTLGHGRRPGGGPRRGGGGAARRRR